MDIAIRKATHQDCEALCDIHVSSIRGLGTSHYSKAEVEAWARGRTPARYAQYITDKHVVIAQDRSTPVAFGTFDLATGELVQLYVRPEYARQGIGTLILDELLRAARAAGLGQVHCLSSLNAADFYIAAGFQPGQPRKHRFRDGGEVDCIPMARVL